MEDEGMEINPKLFQEWKGQILKDFTAANGRAKASPDSKLPVQAGARE